MGKADRVIKLAEATTPPWECELSTVGAGELLTLARGDETMQITWENGGLVHPLVYTLAGVREVKLRNVSAALKLVLGQPEYKTARAPRVVGEPKPKVEPVTAVLPFDIVEATDAEIIKAVRGKKLTWLNDMMGEYESARVPDRKLVEVKDPDKPGQWKNVYRTSPNITMSTSAAGRRILTFPAVNEQYRSVGLDRLVQVK